MAAGMAVSRDPIARRSLGRARHGRCFHGLLVRLPRHAQSRIHPMSGRDPLQAIGSVAVKEFIHIYRDWRILVLLLILPPVFTLIFGHAFESTGASEVPALLENRDQSD